MKIISHYLTVLFLTTTVLSAQLADTTETDSVAMESLKNFEAYDDEGSDVKLFGDYYVDLNRTIKDNIRIFGGDLHVSGTVDGKIIVLGGDVYLDRTAVVNGQIIAIGGVIHRKAGAVVSGKVVEANIKEGITYSEGKSDVIVPKEFQFETDKEYKWDIPSWIHPKTHWFIYNRNEGLLLTPINYDWDRDNKSSFRLSLSLGYRFGQHTPSGKVTFEKSFFKKRLLVLYASVFRESRTDDGYRLPEMENSIASILGRQDFFDRWDEYGTEYGFGIHMLNMNIRYRIVKAEQDSIPVYDIWSVSNKQRALRPNRAFTPKTTPYFETTIALKSTGYSPLNTGLALFLNLEQFSNDKESIGPAAPFSDIGLNQRYWGMTIINWEFSSGIVLRTRIMGGISKGQLPNHRLFGVGGLGSVSAYPYKIQVGNQFAQGNIELVFTPEFLNDDWMLKLFADGGNAWNRTDYNFSDSDNIIENGISSAGVGFGSFDDEFDIGLNIAKPLDGSDYWETTVRMNFTF